jgi:hypothetical protein
MKRRERGNLIPGPFVPLIKTTMATPAWRAMSYGARLVYAEMRGKMRNDAKNNGMFYLSYRDAADALGTKSTRSIVRWIAELEHFGFAFKTRGGFLGGNGRGIAASYRLTEYRYGTNPPTRDFEKWDGKPFFYMGRRPSRKKQNPVSLGDTPRVPQGHIRNGFGSESVCVPQGHIDTTARCAPQGHTSRIRHPRGEGSYQGSSTARAPGQPGGAGSSPAPDAIRPYRHSRDGLMECVLSVVNGQLDELESGSRR